MNTFLRTAISGILLNLPIVSYCQESLPGNRNPWQWPFSQTSIWNMPIGSGAVYEPANFQNAAHVGVDIQHIMELNADDPQRDVLGSTTWGPGRCTGTSNLGFSLRVPDSWIVPDAGNSPYGLTPNSNFAFRMPGSDMVFEGSVVSRCVAGGPVYMPDWMRWPNNRKQQSIKGNGLNGGGQGASGMSALGGTIRLGELIHEAPIRHAIKINPWAEKYCYYSSAIPGYTWPAISADNYAPQQYKGTNPHIVMGSLFAIPPDVEVESLGLKTIPGKKLFFTLQNYGAYFTEDAAWDTWDIIVERGVELEFQQAYGFSMNSQTWRHELNALMKALHIVVNNAPERIGGGGVPIQPLAPEFETTTTGYENHMRFPSDAMQAFPNPITGDLLFFDREIQAEIYNLQGSLLLRTTLQQSMCTANLPAGLYLLRMTDRAGSEQKQLIIKP